MKHQPPPSPNQRRKRPPHYDMRGAVQFITFNLADSIPQTKLAQPRQANQPADWLDAGMGACILRHPKIAHTMQTILQHADGNRYTMLAWCIMPNHVHVLIQTKAPIGQIVRAWKAYASKWISQNQPALGISIPQPIWQSQYWDQCITHPQHCRDAIAYIHHNPVKANLCQTPEQWPWSSARHPAYPRRAAQIIA